MLCLRVAPCLDDDPVPASTNHLAINARETIAGGQAIMGMISNCHHAHAHIVYDAYAIGGEVLITHVRARMGVSGFCFVFSEGTKWGWYKWGWQIYIISCCSYKIPSDR